MFGLLLRDLATVQACIADVSLMEGGAVPRYMVDSSHDSQSATEGVTKAIASAVLSFKTAATLAQDSEKSIPAKR
jgi:hypothetical protein